MARKLCGSLAWLQAQSVIEFVGNPPIERNGGGKRIARRALLNLPEYALYLPARGADLLFGDYPMIGTFAFIDDRDTLPGRRFPELNLIALVDMRRDGLPVFPVYYFVRCWMARPTSAVCSGQAPLSIQPSRSPRQHSSTNASRHGLSRALPTISNLSGAAPR